MILDERLFEKTINNFEWKLYKKHAETGQACPQSFLLFSL